LPQPRAFLAFLVAPIFLWAAVLYFGPSGKIPSSEAASPRIESSVVDTILVYGPAVFDTPTGSPQHHVERFALEVAPGAVYTLRVENGEPGGGGRVSSATILLNGSEIVGSEELDATVERVERTIRPSANTTLEVTVTGSAGSFVRVTIWTLPLAARTELHTNQDLTRLCGAESPVATVHVCDRCFTRSR